MLKEQLPLLKSWTRHISISMMKSGLNESGEVWKLFPIYTCYPGSVKQLRAHVSILKDGIPHLLHSHPEEELIIILSGSVYILTSASDGICRKSPPVGAGSFVYHNSNRPHTICASGPEPAVYVCLKWTGRKMKKREDFLKHSIFAPDYKTDEQFGFKTRTIFESPTEFLTRLHAHVSLLKPGAGYEPHADSHDVVIILLDGIVETLGENLEPKSIIFYRAGEPHGIQNMGTSVARYLVFEFHRHGYLFDNFQIPRLPGLWSH